MSDPIDREALVLELAKLGWTPKEVLRVLNTGEVQKSVELLRLLLQSHRAKQDFKQKYTGIRRGAARDPLLEDIFQDMDQLYADLDAALIAVKQGKEPSLREIQMHPRSRT